MIFKRNAKGLLEREVASSPMHDTVQYFGNQSQNQTVRDSGSRATSLLTQEKKEMISTQNVSPIAGSGYPQEDFPSYVQTNHEMVSGEYLQDMDHSSADVPETTLGEGIIFKGELSFKRYLCINGEFEGVLHSNGKLRVGKAGFVKSNLRLKSAIIEGRVDGNIFVDDLLELRGSACVRGNITARYLRVDDGVTLVGQVNICPEGQGSCQIAQDDESGV